MGKLGLNIIVTNEVPPNTVVAVSSIALCPGDDIICPSCSGIPIVAKSCQTCHGRGKMGMVKEQPGVAAIRNLGEDDASVSK